MSTAENPIPRRNFLTLMGLAAAGIAVWQLPGLLEALEQMPIETDNGTRTSTELSSIEMLFSPFVLAGAEIQITSFPLEEETGLVLIEYERKDAEFSGEDKYNIWKRAREMGMIGRNEKRRDFHIHHLIPISYGIAHDIPLEIIKSVENGIPLRIGEHIDLHREYTIEELGKIALGILTREEDR